MRKLKLQIHRLVHLCLICLLFAPAAAAQNRQLTQEEAAPQTKEKRIALVIGNGDYATARKLANPANDAQDMARELSALGFEVISGTNLNLRQMTDKVREFGDRLRQPDTIGLFYYAGHGVQAAGRNYLIPVEADIRREDEVDFNALNLDQVLRKMATANNGLNIVILDACRNNPFARSWSRGADEGGLAQITAPTGTFIAYATAPNDTADDGAGRNGLYTAELLKYIKQPNLKIEEAFKEITKAVDRTSNGKQIPWTSSSLRGDFYFKIDRPTIARKPAAVEEPPVTARDAMTVEGKAWNSIRNSANPNDFRYFLEEFPNGKFAASAKTRLEQTAWDAIENTTDKTALQNYLKEFPNSPDAALARLRLRRLEASASVSATSNEEAKSEPSVAGKWEFLTGDDAEQIIIGIEFFQTGRLLTGNFHTSDERVKSAIRNGFISGDAITFELILSAGGINAELRFSGKINGNQIVGTAVSLGSQTEQESVPFRGKKIK